MDNLTKTKLEAIDLFLKELHKKDRQMLHVQFARQNLNSLKMAVPIR